MPSTNPGNPISSLIIEKAPLILAEIKKANSILLHCHPSPDPDSVGSVLAMKFVLEGMDKKVTVISGDSVFPIGFEHFPGAAEIQRKTFLDTDLSSFDLFIILDAAAPQQISRYKPITFPLPIRTVVIDHHRTNAEFADVNLVEATYPATTQILYDLFETWGVELSHDIAANLFIGIYTDTGFKYPGTTSRTFTIASKLVELAPDFPDIVAKMENSNTPDFLRFEALALSSIQTFFDGRMALSLISNEALVREKIPIDQVTAGAISPLLRSVREWQVTGILIEVVPGKTKMSFRSGTIGSLDVSALALALDGGGHKAAAGATLDLPIKEACEKVVAKAKELYNFNP